jgi:hypothetical protein
MLDWIQSLPADDFLVLAVCAGFAGALLLRSIVFVVLVLALFFASNDDDDADSP